MPSRLSREELEKIVRYATDKNLKGPERTVRLGETAAAAKKKPGGVLRRFVFEGDTKVSADNRKLLRRFAGNRLYDAVHGLTKAAEALQVAAVWLQRVEDIDKGLLDSNLMRDPDGELRRLIEAQQKRLKALAPIRKAVQIDRARRIKETVDLERELEHEDRRQAREEQKSKAAKTKKSKKQAAEVRFDQHEEDGSPTISLDPTLLAEATKALTLDPKQLRAAAKQAKPNKRPTKP